MSLLDVNGIDVSYGDVAVIHGLSLRVEAGEMVALLGANGAGKTTTLRTISGALAPAAGEIRFAGERIDGLGAHRVVTHGIGHLPEGRELFGQLSVLENLKLGFWPLRKTPGMETAIERAFEMFPILGERASQAAETLSGGEQQMLGVARALMSNPKLLLVDELSLGLAPLIVEQLFDILEEVNAAGTAVLLVEQFVHSALRHSSRAYVLQKGEVVLEGDARELADDPALVQTYLGTG